MGLPLCFNCSTKYFYQYVPVVLTLNKFSVWPTNCCVCGEDHFGSSETNYNIPELVFGDETRKEAILRFFETSFLAHNKNILFMISR